MTVPTLDVELELLAEITRVGIGGGAGGQVVIGIDEVGRGALAGPVAVGAVAIDPRAVTVPDGLRDSKLLSEVRRERLHPVVSVWGSARAVGYATAAEIDDVGITRALGLAGARALAALEAAGIDLRVTIALLDGSHDWLAPGLDDVLPVRTRVKADRDCASVAAASVLAKVHRDRLMATSDIAHPGYGWTRNKGYGAPEHLASLRTVGPSPLHRRSFLRRLLPVDSPEPLAGIDLD